jgi:hypothetical protein
MIMSNEIYSTSHPKCNRFVHETQVFFVVLHYETLYGCTTQVPRMDCPVAEMFCVSHRFDSPTATLDLLQSSLIRSEAFIM